MEGIVWDTSCFFSNNAIHCKIITEHPNLEFAYYININDEGREVLFYPQPNEIVFSCKQRIVDFFEVTFFVKDENGNILSVTKKQRTPWSLCDAAIYTIMTLTDDNSTIVELGSGYGSSLISKNRNLVAIEHDERFVSRYPDVNYLYSPLVSLQGSDKPEQLWYDSELISNGIPAKHDLIILDGPPADVGRTGVLQNLSLFDPDAIWIIDDVVRPSEQYIANVIAIHFSHFQYKFWNFSILTRKPLDPSTLEKIKHKSHSVYLSMPHQYLLNYFASPPHFEHQ
tara:strand:+ start:29 stop:877 length:849 start_codon:yes stop_codon:yes gene_type:complete